MRYLKIFYAISVLLLFDSIFSFDKTFSFDTVNQSREIWKRGLRWNMNVRSGSTYIHIHGESRWTEWSWYYSLTPGSDWHISKQIIWRCNVGLVWCLVNGAVLLIWKEIVDFGQIFWKNLSIEHFFITLSNTFFSLSHEIMENIE